jgi:hypothetical protein
MNELSLSFWQHAKRQHAKNGRPTGKVRRRRKRADRRIAAAQWAMMILSLRPLSFGAALAAGSVFREMLNQEMLVQ